MLLSKRKKLKKSNRDGDETKKNHQRKLSVLDQTISSLQKQKFHDNIRPKTANYLPELTRTSSGINFEYGSDGSDKKGDRNSFDYYRPGMSASLRGDRQSLPSLDFGLMSTSSEERYYGGNAKNLFYDTYRQLKSRGEVMLGGYTELEEWISKPDEENLFNQSLNALEAHGILTPPISSRNVNDQRKLQSFFDDNEDDFSNFITNRSFNQHAHHNTAVTNTTSTAAELHQLTVNISSPISKSHTRPLIGPEDVNQLWSTLHNNKTKSNESKAFLKSLSLPIINTELLNAKSQLELNFKEPSITHSESAHLREDSLLSSTSQESHAVMSNYTSNSPRAVFLTGCLKNGLLPLSSPLLRRKFTSTIDLSHMSVGDAVATILAKCITDLPNLHSLILTDNNLTDHGLSPLIKSIAYRDDVQLLDLSQNKIDFKTSHALKDYIGNKKCTLKALRVSGADIDDQECAVFVNKFDNNIHLKELDLSKNVIGKDEYRNTVQPNFVTGAEAIAKLLQRSTCPLQSLNMHWNMVRLRSAVALCAAMKLNQSLTKLDLSYNGLGREAAEILGASLMENKSLKHLNLAQNGIDSIGCFTLLVGVRENQCLEMVNIDGNPIGELGGRMLIKLAYYCGHRLKLSAKNCEFIVKSTDKKFNINEPCSAYQLDLGIPYERAILIELLYIIADNPAIDIESFQYAVGSGKSIHPHGTQHNHHSSPSKLISSNTLTSITTSNTNETTSIGMKRGSKIIGKNSASLANQFHKLDTVRSFVPIEHLTTLEEIEFNELSAISPIADMSPNQVIKKIDEFDPKGMHMFETRYLQDVLRALGIFCPQTVTDNVKYAMDPHDRGLISLNEFAAFMIKRGQIANGRIKQLKVHCWLSLQISQPKRYVPPAYGKVKITVIEKLLLDGSDRQLSQNKCKQIMEAAENTSNPLPLLFYCLDAYSVFFEEAKLLYHHIMNRTQDAVLALSRILPRMCLTEDAMLLLKAATSNDVVRLRRLKQKLGNAFHPLVGIFSGFYSLDLTIESDRVCLKRLIEQSIRNESYRKHHGLGDTSQNGNWNSFRNEYHYQYETDITISPKHFYPIPSKGKVEFDFINIARPSKAMMNQTIYDDKLIDIILVSRLVPDNVTATTRCANRLNELAIANRRSFLANGNPYWKTDWARGEIVGDVLYSMYSSLASRKQSIAKSNKRELLRLEGQSMKKISSQDMLSSMSNPGDNYKGKQQPAAPVLSNQVNVAVTAMISNLPEEEAERISSNNPLSHHYFGSQPTMSQPSADDNLLEDSLNQMVLSMDTISGSTDYQQQPLTMESIGYSEDMESNLNSPVGLIPWSRSKGPKSKAALRPISRLMVADNVQEDIQNFRYLPNKEYDLGASTKGWMKKLFEVMFDSRYTDEFKSSVLLEFFEMELTHVWLNCKHLSLLLEVFKMGSVNKSNLGSYRVELIVILFDRLVDLHNLEYVFMVLSPDEQAAVYARIGVLNVFNPCKPEGTWKLDLLRYDERQMAKMLVHLCVSEPGENWANKSFQYDHGFHSIAGWDLTVIWFTEDHLPKKGIVCVDVFTGDGMNLNGCTVNRRLRNMLTSLVLVEQRDLVSEIENSIQLSDEKVSVVQSIVPPGHGVNVAKGKSGRKGKGLVLNRNETEPHKQIRLNDRHDWPVLPSVKLTTQIGLIDRFNFSTKQQKKVIYTYEDCNQHLADETEIKWIYSTTFKKGDQWNHV